MLPFNLTRSLSKAHKQIISASPSYLIICYYDIFVCLKQFRCITIKILNNCWQLVVVCPGVTQLKTSYRREVYFLVKKVSTFSS